MAHRRAFTLIEILMVTGIIAVVSTVVVLTLGPAELLRQSRDANRIADVRAINSAVNIYATDRGGLTGFSLGNASTVYVSVPDPTLAAGATGTCTGLGLSTSALPFGWNYLCTSSSTYLKNNGTGWIPIDFTKVSAGSPLSKIPLDPINAVSSTGNYFYTYVTNGSKFEVAANMESVRRTANETVDGGLYDNLYEQGSNLSLLTTNVAPYAETTIFSDNFNRVSLGTAYDVLIASCCAAPSLNGSALGVSDPAKNSAIVIATTTAIQNDQFIRATMVNVTANGISDLVLRATLTSDKSSYVTAYDAEFGQLFDLSGYWFGIYYYADGSWHSIYDTGSTAFPIPIPNGSVVEFRVAGGTLEFLINGRIAWTGKDSHVGSGMPGVTVFGDMSMDAITAGNY